MVPGPSVLHIPGMSDTPRPPSASASLSRRIARRLEEQAVALTDRWLEELDRRLDLHPSRLLPTEALRDHVPEVVAGLSDALRGPGRRPASASGENLRRLARLRREQGYELREVLVEFEDLADLVFHEVEREVARSGDAEALEVARVHGALRSALGRIGVLTAETYREAEIRERREAADRLEEFGRTLEHEIRGPLQAALTSAEVLRSEAAQEEAAERQRYAEVITDRLARVGTLLEEVREITAAREGRPARWVPARQVFRDVVDEVEARAREAGVRVEIADPPPDALRLDATRVEVALRNLVSNAVKYADPDKEERWVRVSLERPGGRGSEEEAVGPGDDGAWPEGRAAAPEGPRRWRIVVEDNGLGIPPEVGERIFRRHVRAHPGVGEGTGVGLSIVKEVMDRRGGRVTFESEEGRGSRFVLELPPALAGADEGPAAEGPAAEGSEHRPEPGAGEEPGEAGRGAGGG